MKKISMFVAAVATVASMGTAMAATDGELDYSSTGDFEINYSRGAKIQVWGFRDVHFAAADGVAEHTEAMSLCAMSTSEEVRFKVASAFYMDGDKGAYSITIADKKDANKSDVWGDKGLVSNASGGKKFTAKNVAEDVTTATCGDNTDYHVANLTVDLNDSGLAEGAYKQTVTVTAFPI